MTASLPGRGLILCGGAVRGAFQAGVVAALDRAGARFDAIAGASVGAVNGAALLLGYGARLPEMWLESLSGVRWFEPRRLLGGRSPFLISESMRIMVTRYGGGPTGMARVREHPTELLISATEWDTGRNVLFSSKDEAAGWTDEERVLQFLASLTIPLVCTERIVIRGKRYCDGAFSGNFPLEALVARGCRDVTIVDPSPNALETAFARAFRPFARGLGRMPFPGAALAAGFVQALLGRPPVGRDGVRIRFVTPERPLGIKSLDFTSMDAVRRALDMGVAAGERLASDYLSEPSISSANVR